jgi:intein/homing endonuclease/ATP-dependent protease ClpP protease subunit
MDLNKKGPAKQDREEEEEISPSQNPNPFAELAYETYQELKEERIILINGDLKEDLIEKAAIPLMQMAQEKGPIQIYINSYGGCLTGDSLIYTLNGLKSITQVNVGDLVYSINEKSKEIVIDKVTKTWENGTKKVYEISVLGRTIKATGNHKFLTIEQCFGEGSGRARKYAYVWKPLDEIREEDLIAIPKELPDFGKSYNLPKLGEGFRKYKDVLKVPEVTTDEFMWIIGMFFGDGYIPSVEKLNNIPGLGCIYFSVPKSDASRKKLQTSLKHLFGINSRQTLTDVVLFSRVLARWFHSLGFEGKAQTKRLPAWVFSLPKSQRLSLLAGILDSDGYLVDEKFSSNYAIELCNEDLITDIKLLAISCGFRVSTYNRTRKSQVNSEYPAVLSHQYRLRISGKLSSIPTRNSSKLQRALKADKKKKLTNWGCGKSGHRVAYLSNQFVGVGKVDKKTICGAEQVYDITTEKHHNFIANGIFVHNSIDDSQAIVDIIQTIDNPVITMAFGKAMSAGFDIFLAGDYRISYPNTVFMCHSGSASLGPQTLSAINVEAKLHQQHFERWAKFYASRTKVSEKEWLDLLNGSLNKYYFPEDALAKGIVHHVVSAGNKPSLQKILKLKW